MKEVLKMEGSPSEVGPAHAASEAASAEAHPDDHLSDDEQGTEFEALQHLPPEERRKALRRLRNRESARRVRARRLAEMSQMGTTLQSLQDENSTLKAHVNKLQSHIQSMTLKVYEVTSKYEAAVAESAQLRAELNRYRRPSVPGDSSFLLGTTAPTAAPTGNGPNSAPLHQLSPFISPMEIGRGGPGTQSSLSPGHIQLRSSSPMGMQRQRQAIDEVVMLLKEHKRRHHPGQDRSGHSEIGSNGAGAAGSGAGGNVKNSLSSASDTAMPGGGGTRGSLGDLAAGVLGTNNSTTANNNGLLFNVGSMPRFMGAAVNSAMGASGLGSGSGGCRSSQSEVLTGSAPHLQLMSQVQARMAAAAAAAEVAGGGSSLCTPILSNSVHNMGAQMQQQQQQQQQQQLQQQSQSQPLPLLPMLPQAPPLPQQVLLMDNPGPAATLSLPLPGQQQQQQVLGQSNSHPLMQLQPLSSYQHQFSMLGQQQQQQQQMMADGQQHGIDSSALYGTMSTLSLSAPFCSAASALPCIGSGSAAGGGGLQMTGHSSGPNALCNGVSGICPMAPAPGFGGQQHHHCSACVTSAQNVVAMHPTWQANAGALGAGLLMRPEDFTDDLMFLDDYVPQDL